MIIKTSQSVLRRIAIGVIGFHAALLLWAAVTVSARQLPPLKERLVVKTVALNPQHTVIAMAEPPPPLPPEPEPAPPPIEEPPPEPPAPVAVEEIAPPPPEPEPEPVKADPPKEKPKKDPPKKKSKKLEKKKAPDKPLQKKAPKVEKKPEPPSKKEDAKAAAQAKRRALLAQAKKKIAQIEQGHATLDSNAVVPAKIGALQVEAMGKGEQSTLTSQEVTYIEELAARLKLKLRLPEYGEVKIKLTLSRGGNFVKVVVNSAESNKNRQYIEKTLPTLAYPPFGKNFSGADHYTFTITLSNEF